MAALCLSASVIVPAQANDIVLLPDIPADQIARDTVRSYDSSTGISIVTASTFDPFEQDNTLAGTAALRSGPSEIAIDGTPTAGGAYLDLKMIYTSASDDPYDLRGFDRAFYVSGDEVSRTHQDVRTLDCAANTTEVVYEDNYYDSYDNYGYLAGLYLLLPRYRGHRGFWSGTSRYRPSISWSDWRKRSAYSHYGGGYYSGFRTTGRGAGVRTSRIRRDDDRGRNTARTTRRNNDGRASVNRNDNGRAGDTERPRTNTARTERHNARDSVVGGSRGNREYRRQRGVVTGGPLQRSRENQTEQSRRTDRRAAERAESRNNRSNGSARTDAVGRTDRGRGSNPAAGRTQPPVTNRRANPVGSAPKTIARSSPPSTVNSSRSNKSAPKAQRQSQKKSTSKSSSKSRSSRNLNRAVDNSFKNSSRSSRGKKLNFFPMLNGYTQISSSVITNYRCVREESVSLHIPQERLDAARFDGMTIIIVDNADRDVPVYLPPNYIEGFRQAVGSGSYSSSSSRLVTPPAAYQDPVYSQPSYQGGYPQN